MTYYTPDNPNHALVAPQRKHPVRNGIRITLAVLVSVLLVCTLTLTIVLSSFRAVLTPEYVYRYMNRVDFTALPLPTDDGYMTISQLMQDSFGAVGMELAESDVSLLFEQFSIPTILASYGQDVTAWLLNGAARPVLDPEEIASIALSGMDSAILNVLYFLGDPVELLSEILITPLSTLDTEGLFDRLEPVRLLLSADTTALLASVSLILAVLLFCLCRCRPGRFWLPASVSMFVTALLTGGVGLVFKLLLPEFTGVYAAYAVSFLRPVQIFFWQSALFCCLTAVVFMVSWLLRFLLFADLITGRIRKRTLCDNEPPYPEC